MTTQLAVHELSMMRDLCKKDHMETQAEVLDCAIWAIQTQDTLKKERDAALARNKVIDQIRWERDTAIAQLAELGYGFGEKIRTDGDCVSRQAAIDAVRMYYDEFHEGDPDSVEDALKALPSAQPESQWIPCSERLPEKNGRYLVWAIVSFVPDHVEEPCTYQKTTIANFFTCRGRSIWDGHSVEKVLAWRELPEPLRGEEHDRARNSRLCAKMPILWKSEDDRQQEQLQS